MIRNIFAVAAILFLTNCKSSKNKEVAEKNTATSEQKVNANSTEKPNTVKTEVAIEPTPAKEEEAPTAPKIQIDSTIYSLVVSFYSIGSGIDFNVAKEYNQMLNSYTTAEGLLLDFDKVSWGREGETDFCIRLNGFSKKEKEIFLEKSQGILKKTERVHTKENASCRQKRPR
jgi:hypothetical protein